MLMLLLRRLQLLCLLQVLLLFSAQPPVWPLHCRNLVLSHSGHIRTIGNSSHGSCVCGIPYAQATVFKNWSSNPAGAAASPDVQLLSPPVDPPVRHPSRQKTFATGLQEFPNTWTLFMPPSDCVPATAVFRCCDPLRLGKVCKQNHIGTLCHPRFNMPCTKGAQTCTRAVQKCTKCQRNASKTDEPSTFQHWPVRARCAMIPYFAQLVPVPWLCH